MQDRWRETRREGFSLRDADVYRVETDPWGLSELRNMEAEWRLTGRLD